MTICREPDGTTPCKYATYCSEDRQFLQAGYVWDAEGHTVQRFEPLRGTDCPFYQGFLQNEQYEPPKEVA